MPEVMQMSCFEEHVDCKSLLNRNENKQKKLISVIGLLTFIESFTTE